MERQWRMGDGAWRVLVLLAALAPLPAAAHGARTDELRTYTQTLGAHEVTIVMQPTSRVPGPLALTVWLRGPDAPALVLRATPAAAWPADGNRATVQVLAGDRGPYHVVLQVDRHGLWELDLQLSSPTAETRATLPFTVVDAAGDQSRWWPHALFGVAGVMVLASAAAGLTRRLPVLAWLGAAAALVALSVAATLAAQQAFMPPRPATPVSVPHINAAFAFAPARPVVGSPLLLGVRLSDGGTGQVVDDVTVLHTALLHLVIVSDDGANFAHLHPARTAPGSYQVGFTPRRVGGYTAYLEIARNGGAQVVARRFVVAGEPGVPVATPGFGTQTVADLRIAVDSPRTPLRTGEPQTLTLRVTGQSATTIEPWLGMAGHMIIVASDGSVFGHVHGTLLDAQTATLAFTYQFPAAGTYRLWGQFQHAGQLITVPFTIDVTS